METKILLSEDLCKIDAFRYVASRYGTTPEKVLMHYFVRTGIDPFGNMDDEEYDLKPNEPALFHDLGVQSAIIEKNNII